VKPKFTRNPLKPTFEDPTVYQDSILSINTALQIIKSSSGQASKMPLLTALSTTGISENQDVPIMMTPLYRWMLAVPHANKEVLEDRIVKAKEENLIRDYVVIRPSLLTDERINGKTEIKVSWEGKAPGKLGDGAAVGYKITREDVGYFVFESVIANSGGELVGKKISITH
ncbi:MAG: hypothetical protein Q9225_007010, partial [Loekoesia sp. 1 TL-2023]